MILALIASYPALAGTVEDRAASVRGLVAAGDCLPALTMADALVAQSDTDTAWSALADAALCAGVLDRATEALGALERLEAPAATVDGVRSRIDRAAARNATVGPAPTLLAPGQYEAPPAPEFGDVSRNFLHGVNFRGRYLFIPDSILDIWYEDHRDDGSGVPERPSLGAYALGMEYVLDGGQNAGIFYVEYLKPSFDAGYWDDREEPPDNTDGSWIKPDEFGLVVLGADYSAQFRANSWFGFTVGAGMGVGIRTGRLLEWQPGEPVDVVGGNNAEPDCGRDEAAYLRATHCAPDGADDGALEIPGAIPFIDVNVGPKFYFSDKATLKIEGGLHNLPYVGATFGATF
jgi:hypothetical protein